MRVDPVQWQEISVPAATPLVEVPSALAAAVGPSAGHDHVDAFAVTVTGPGRTPLGWAREVFEGAPAPVRWSLAAGWRAGLLLAPAPAGAERVLGWEVVDATAEVVVLTRRSPLFDARLAFGVEGDRVVSSTFVGFERPVARLLWAPTAVLHRRIVPWLLGRAARAPGRS